MGNHAEPTPPRATPSRMWSIVPFVVAGLFVTAAALALVAPDLRLRLGPLRVSFGDASRLVLQASLAVLAAVTIATGIRRRGVAILAAAAAVLGAAAFDSVPRRVGDGAEYVAMALQMREGQAPALTPDRRVELERRLRATAGFEDARLERPTLVGRDGRQDFHHFWLYSLVVAPWLAMTDAAGWHPVRAFTLTNVVLLMALVWVLARRGDEVAAALFAAGPIVWWVDKAHAEVFLVVLVAVAMCTLTWRPGLALACAGAAAAQNPATLPVLAVGAGWVWSARATVGTTRAWRAIGAGAGLALLHPAYYLVHLGRVSPLTEVAGYGVPGLRAILSPLIDPNIGLVANALPWAAMSVAGAAWAPARERRLVGAAAVLLLAIAARTPNANHGGTPGMSRYGLWLLAVLSPWLCVALREVRQRSPWALTVAALASLLVTWSTFRPTLLDRSGGGPSTLADALWKAWPALDNPLPEIFAERAARVDGTPPAPIAIEGCAKVMTRGDGAEAWWPFPCEPGPAPAWCTSDRTLCYVNRGRFASVPRQQTFEWDPVPERAWTERNRGWLPALASRLGATPRAVPLGRARRIEGAVDVDMPLIVEGSRATAVWLRTRDGAAPRLRLRLGVPAAVDVLDPATGALVFSTSVPPDRRDLSLPALRSLLVVVTEAGDQLR